MSLKYYEYNTCQRLYKYAGKYEYKIYKTLWLIQSTKGDCIVTFFNINKSFNSSTTQHDLDISQLKTVQRHFYFL